MRRGSHLSDRSLVLAFFHAASGRALDVATLVKGTAILGLSGNSTRVALSRLVDQELVRSDQRGWYRLRPTAAASPRKAHDWRLGEERVRKWEGGWLSALGPSRVQTETKTRRALELLGFRLTAERLMVRPDNLREGLAELAKRALALGGNAQLRFFELRAGEPRLVREAWSRLWQPAALERRYRGWQKKLKTSRERLSQKPRERALAETFALGRTCIAELEQDPLLPAEIIDITLRKKLTFELSSYEQYARHLWAQAMPELALVNLSALNL